MDFYIDTSYDNEVSLNKKESCNEGLPTEINELLLSVRKANENVLSEKPTESCSDVDLFCNNLSTIIGKKRRPLQNNLSLKKLLAEENHKAENTLKKSVVTSKYNTMAKVPAYDLSDRKLKKLRKRERNKTKGAKWYNLPATAKTPEIKRDLQVLQMRSVLDPKHFYKKNDMKGLPKYFHIGKVMDSPLDFYNNRCTKSERKRTMVDELLADAEFQKFNKRKYAEVVEEQKKTHYKAYIKAKRLKRKNKK